MAYIVPDSRRGVNKVTTTKSQTLNILNNYGTTPYSFEQIRQAGSVVDISIYRSKILASCAKILIGVGEWTHNFNKLVLL